ncbi:MAG: DUF423 domain-containing protein [Schleiferiaceae bacterium]|nr:DUF423 domain-containing protein [Schleiferiaceae bacterium]MDR9442295.1 DUF423 domain-containing protein [Schleiferiaceae bacterium]
MKNNSSFMILAAAVLGAVAVMAGALGAHALEAHLSPGELTTYRTAVRYLAWHALALLGLAGLRRQGFSAVWVARLWLLGSLLFSGSIFLLVLDQLWGAAWSWLGPITPLGGLLLIAGWVLLAVKALEQMRVDQG